MIPIPYGRGALAWKWPYEGLLTSRLDSLKSEKTGLSLVETALENPIGSPTLPTLAAGKKTCTILISDHTRPVPSRDILPPVLRQLRQGNPDIQVTLLVATGFHRLTTTAELEAKLGSEIARRERIVVHNASVTLIPNGISVIVTNKGE